MPVLAGCLPRDRSDDANVAHNLRVDEKVLVKKVIRLVFIECKLLMLRFMCFRTVNILMTSVGCFRIKI
jgi:hypothetical protein